MLEVVPFGRKISEQEGGGKIVEFKSPGSGSEGGNPV